MAQPYIGEIRMFGGNFAPAGWNWCDGTLLAISENDALFTLIGTTYGGDGQVNFAVPDLRGRLPLHMGPLNQTGAAAGVETVTLSTQQLPVHTHPLIATTSAGNVPDPGNNILAQTTTANVDLYLEIASPTVPLTANAVTPTGGSQPHDNRHPYQCVGFIISLFGIYPSQT